LSLQNRRRLRFQECRSAIPFAVISTLCALSHGSLAHPGDVAKIKRQRDEGDGESDATPIQIRDLETAPDRAEDEPSDKDEGCEKDKADHRLIPSGHRYGPGNWLQQSFGGILTEMFVDVSKQQPGYVSGMDLSEVVPPAGIEPATFGLQNRCSTS
jgi:hypothetical protein